MMEKALRIGLVGCYIWLGTYIIKVALNLYYGAPISMFQIVEPIAALTLLNFFLNLKKQNEQ